VGNGWEAGFIFAGEPIFIGNFIHRPEAVRWFALMNREIRLISKRFAVGGNLPLTWARNLIKNQLYKTYYVFIDRLLVRHVGESNRAVVRDVRKFKQIRKLDARRGNTRRVPLLKAA